MKKFLITILCVAMITTIGTGSFPRRAHAGKVIDVIVAFVAAPLVLLDPLTSLVIIDAFSCKINIIWGCDKNGAPLPEPKPVVTVTVPATVELPNPVQVSWTSNARAVSCEASGDWSGVKALTGSEKTINPTNPASLGVHTYILSCKNSEGGVGTATASTNIIGPSVSITTPTTVEVPSPIILKWNAQNAVSCEASGEWSGSKGLSGTETLVTPTNTGLRGAHTYGLTCVNGSGYTASTSVLVRVIQVPKCTFSASPDVITPPQRSQLVWTCDYATACSIDHGLGAVDPTSGSRMVVPPKTTEYMLDCQGIDGSRPFPVTVGIPGTGGVSLPGGATTSPRIHEVNP